MARRHPLLVFFALAYAISWAYEIGVLVMLRHGDSGGLWVCPATFGPLIAAFITAYWAEGGAGVRALLSRMGRWRFGVIWYAIILIGLPLAAIVMAALYMVRVPESPTPLPDLLTGYLFSFVIVGLVGGPLGEELGWRGFALPRLQSRFGALGASLVLGPIWSLWHLPLYFTDYGAERGGFEPLAFGLYTLGVIGFAVTLTWIFNNTRGSALAATLAHAAINSSLGVSLLLAKAEMTDAANILAVGFGVIAIVLVVATRGKLGYVRESPAS